MSSSKANSNTKHKVELNLKPSHNNPTIQLVCLGDLPTFVPPTIPYVFEIFILPYEGNEPKSIWTKSNFSKIKLKRRKKNVM